MSLPKNFQQTVNLTKRVEALNDLTFYLFDYEVKLTKETIKEIYSNDFDEFEKLSILGEVKFLGNKKAECKSRVSALDKEKSEEKFKEIITKAIDFGLIESFKIKSVTEKTFADEIDDKNLTELLNLKRD
jgi:hypothetical protein